MVNDKDTLIELLDESTKERYLTLLNSVTDAYYRMSTSSDEHYINIQKSKCETWLKEMTNIMLSLDLKIGG